jgi:hypothetical protein
MLCLLEKRAVRHVSLSREVVRRSLRAKRGRFAPDNLPRPLGRLKAYVIESALSFDTMPDTRSCHLPIPSLCTLPCQAVWLFVCYRRGSVTLVAFAPTQGEKNQSFTVDSLNVCAGMENFGYKRPVIPYHCATGYRTVVRPISYHCATKIG